MQLLVVLLFLLCPFSDIYAQGSMNLKNYNIPKSETETLAGFSGGKVWLDRTKKRLCFYAGDEIRVFGIKEKKLSVDGVFRFIGDELNLTGEKTGVPAREKPESGDAKKTVLKYFWEFRVQGETITSLTSDINGENLYLADQNGQIYFYNLKKKEFIGRLIFEKKPVKQIRALRNGSLLLFYEGGEAAYIKKVKVPFFSFFQDFKSSYELKHRTALPGSFISRIEINDSENKAAVTADHKNVIIVELPALREDKSFKEKRFIDFVDFIDDDNLIYTAMAEKSVTAPFDVHSHLASLAGFFDWRKYIIPSPTGRYFIRISDKNSLKLYDLYKTGFISDIGLDIKGVGEIKFAEDESRFFILNSERNKITVYDIRQ